jgi:hypothetical protein
MGESAAAKTERSWERRLSTQLNNRKPVRWVGSFRSASEVPSAEAARGAPADRGNGEALARPLRTAMSFRLCGRLDRSDELTN